MTGELKQHTFWNLLNLHAKLIMKQLLLNAVIYSQNDKTTESKLRIYLTATAKQWIIEESVHFTHQW